MSLLSCLRSSDPNIKNVELLYFEDEDNGNLWNGTGAAPLCSDISPPSPSKCVVCFQKVVHAVCSNLADNRTLVMEGPGRLIRISESECPVFEGFPNTTTPPNTTTFQNMTSSSSSTDLHWLWLLLLLLIIIIAGAFYYRRKISQAIRNWRRREPVSADDPEDGL